MAGCVGSGEAGRLLWTAFGPISSVSFSFGYALLGNKGLQVRGRRTVCTGLSSRGPWIPGASGRVGMNVQELLLASGNERCADCRAAGPRWASLNLQTLICLDCSGVHRDLGPQISKVRSISLDSWDSAMLQSVLSGGGNARVNAVLEAQLPSDFKRPNPAVDPYAMRVFLLDKYVHKRFARSTGTAVTGKPAVSGTQSHTPQTPSEPIKGSNGSNIRPQRLSGLSGAKGSQDQQKSVSTSSLIDLWDASEAPIAAPDPAATTVVSQAASGSHAAPASNAASTAGTKTGSAVATASASTKAMGRTTQASRKDDLQLSDLWDTRKKPEQLLPSSSFPSDKRKTEKGTAGATIDPPKTLPTIDPARLERAKLKAAYETTDAYLQTILKDEAFSGTQRNDVPPRPMSPSTKLSQAIARELGL